MTADAWQAFEYEVQMFYATRARLKDPGLDTIVHNALVESSLLHPLVRAILGQVAGIAKRPLLSHYCA